MHIWRAVSALNYDTFSVLNDESFSVLNDER